MAMKNSAQYPALHRPLVPGPGLIGDMESQPNLLSSHLPGMGSYWNRFIWTSLHLAHWLDSESELTSLLTLLSFVPMDS